LTPQVFRDLAVDRPIGPTVDGRAHLGARSTDICSARV
jgi:hypothetical protein